MGKAAPIARYALPMTALYAVFAVLGHELASAALLSAVGRSTTGWKLYVAGMLLAVSAPIIAAGLTRSGGQPLGRVRAGLAGFAVFFCSQLVVGGLPDLSPLPLGLGLAVCGASAVAAIAVSRGRAGAKALPGCASSPGVER